MHSVERFLEIVIEAALRRKFEIMANAAMPWWSRTADFSHRILGLSRVSIEPFAIPETSGKRATGIKLT